MSDQRLRELERRWTETGDPEDEAAFLRASVRAGTLDKQRLRLAACVDYGAARDALDMAPSKLGGPDEVLQALERYGHDVLIRGGVAVLRALAVRWAVELPEDPRVAEALVAVEAWLEAPSPETAGAAREAASTVGRAANEALQNVVDSWELYFEDRRVDRPEPTPSAVYAIARVARALAGGVTAETGALIDLLCEHLSLCLEGEAIDLRYEYGGYREERGWAHEVADRSHLQDAIRDTLGPWALGRVEVTLAPAAATTDLAALPQAQLELLAYCGQGEAQDLAPDAPAPPRDLEAWVRGLERFGREALAVAALAVADTAQQYWEDPHDVRPRAALSAVAVWITAPCDEHVDDAIAALDGAVDAMAETAPLARKKHGATPHCAAEVAARVIEVVCEDDAAEAAWATVEAARVGLATRRLLEVMRAGLIEWASARRSSA